MFNLTPWKKRDGSGALAHRGEHPLSLMRNEFDALFDRFFGRFPAPFDADWGETPAWGLDVNDAGNEVVVRAEVPGFEAGDFDIQVSGNLLNLKAEQKHEAKEEKDNYQFTERRFQRSVTLPAGTVADKVEAVYKNGILEIRLPKSPDAQGRRITVKT